MKILLCFLAVVASAVVGSAPANSCTPIRGYQAPTNLEMVALADLIVLARIDDGMHLEEARRRVLEDPNIDGSITVTPLSTLKGDLPETQLVIPETYIATPSEYHLAFPSNPFDLRQPHPEAFAGGCARTTFVPGRVVVFFLSQLEAETLPVNFAFSRWAEDVPSDDAPWVRAIRIYAAALELPEAERQASLIATRDRFLALEDDLDAALTAADIDRQLADWDPDMQDASPSDGDDAAYQAMRDVGAAADAVAREMEEELDAAVREMDAMAAEMEEAAESQDE